MTNAMTYRTHIREEHCHYQDTLLSGDQFPWENKSNSFTGFTQGEQIN